MAKAPRNAWEELTQITDEFRVMHARVNGETHAQAARAEDPQYSKAMQQAALTRWNCETLTEYKAVHARVLRATRAHLRETATKADPNTRWGQQLITAHAYLSMMLELALALPTPSKPRTGKRKRRSAQNQDPGMARDTAGNRNVSGYEDPQSVYVPPPALRRFWAHSNDPSASPVME